MYDRDESTNFSSSHRENLGFDFDSIKIRWFDLSREERPIRERERGVLYSNENILGREEVDRSLANAREAPVVFASGIRETRRG